MVGDGPGCVGGMTWPAADRVHAGCWGGAAAGPGAVARWSEGPLPQMVSLSQQSVTVLRVYRTLSMIRLLFSLGLGAHHLGSIGSHETQPVAVWASQFCLIGARSFGLVHKLRWCGSLQLKNFWSPKIVLELAVPFASILEAPGVLLRANSQTPISFKSIFNARA